MSDEDIDRMAEDFVSRQYEDYVSTQFEAFVRENAPNFDCKECGKPNCECKCTGNPFRRCVRCKFYEPVPLVDGEGHCVKEPVDTIGVSEWQSCEDFESRER